MGNPHVIAIPYPAQGHVLPLMEFALSLVNQGFKVTFVNTEFNHKRVMKALSEQDNVHDLIHLVSVPDGLEPWEDRNDLAKLSTAMVEVMPGKLQELIQKIKDNDDDDDDEITCIIADGSMGWALEIAKNMGIKRAAFWPASAALLGLVRSIPKLIADGIINNDGRVMTNQMIQLSPTMPPMNTSNLVWACIGDLPTQKIIFDFIVGNNKSLELANWMVCNSTYELEPAAFTLFPDISPIGPLLASTRLGKSPGYFWPEDSTCLKWLNQQQPHSVIYVAFGSFTIFDKKQFRELALGLELTNMPFLWVVRPDLTSETNDDDVYPKGYIERVGLGFNRDDNGIICREEIKNRVEQLLGDESFKAKALDLKEKAMNGIKKSGDSHKSFNNFVEWTKGKEK
ncbi:unnamed protein product [Ilex paraguariensis]|uniref:Uncharacterized protein n=1 Tax=Ilex paraguariensis TaxID=185542 RepID=A0ABC8ULP7_9AQUA